MHREAAWWKKKRLNTSPDSWEGLVAEYCGFDWQGEEVEEEEEEVEEVEAEGGFSEVLVEKETEIIANDINMEDSSWPRGDTNLDELVFNENKIALATHTEEKREEDIEDASEAENDGDQFKLNKELVNPVHSWKKVLFSSGICLKFPNFA